VKHKTPKHKVHAVDRFLQRYGAGLAWESPETRDGTRVRIHQVPNRNVYFVEKANSGGRYVTGPYDRAAARAVGTEILMKHTSKNRALSIMSSFGEYREHEYVANTKKNPTYAVETPGGRATKVQARGPKAAATAAAKKLFPRKKTKVTFSHKSEEFGGTNYFVREHGRIVGAVHVDLIKRARRLMRP